MQYFYLVFFFLEEVRLKCDIAGNPNISFLFTLRVVYTLISEKFHDYGERKSFKKSVVRSSNYARLFIQSCIY